MDLRAAVALPSPLAAALSTSALDAAAPRELGGAFIGGAADGPPGLPTEMVRAIAQALESSLATLSAAQSLSAASLPTDAPALQDAFALPPAEESPMAWQGLASAAIARAAADDMSAEPPRVQNQVLIDRDAQLALQVPQPAGRAIDALAVPVLLSPLHAGPLSERRLFTVQQRWREQEPSRDNASLFEPSDDDEPDDSEPPRDPALADEVRRELLSVRRFRRLWRHAQTAPQSSGLALHAELAQRRRALLIAPTGRAGAPGDELEAYLLAQDVHGVGHAARYRARGALAAAQGSAADAWPQWRVHRDVAIDGQLRLVVTRGMGAAQAKAGAPRPAATALSVRLTVHPRPAPLRDARTSWFDILDVRRFMHDLGTQWSLLILWSPQAVAASPMQEPRR